MKLVSGGSHFSSKPFSLRPREASASAPRAPLVANSVASQMGICVCCVRARHSVTVTEASQWRLVEAPTRGRKRAFDAIDPDEVFDRQAILEEARQVDRLHRQAKQEAKRQQHRPRHHDHYKKGPLKSIPEQGDGEEDV